MHPFTLRTWLLGLLMLLAGAKPAAAQRVAASQNFTLSIHPDGTLWAWGETRGGQLGLGTSPATYQAAPQQVGTAANWASVSAGFAHAVAVRTDGTLWAWGPIPSASWAWALSTVFSLHLRRWAVPVAG